jgi:hypothetical protein
MDHGPSTTISVIGSARAPKAARIVARRHRSRPVGDANERIAEPPGTYFDAVISKDVPEHLSRW